MCLTPKLFPYCFCFQERLYLSLMFILNLKLTHREMASIIGASRETVSFAILDLRKRGTIQADGKRVVLVDMDAIQALLNET